MCTDKRRVEVTASKVQSESIDGETLYNVGPFDCGIDKKACGDLAESLNAHEAKEPVIDLFHPKPDLTNKERKGIQPCQTFSANGCEDK